MERDGIQQMLINSFESIGRILRERRQCEGLTQAQAAEMIGLSDRSYAEIERGKVNMRMETLLRICDKMHITPNELLLPEQFCETLQQQELLLRLDQCSPAQRETALHILETFLQFLQK